MKAKFLVLIVLMSIVILPTTATATVELTKKLPVALHEGEEINFSIKIKDFNDDAKSIVMETNLAPVDNKPLYDFGEANQFISSNRYQQKITLDLKSLPQKIISVTISGKAPNGETKTKLDKSDLVITKFVDSKQKYYEVRIDEKLEGIESFELVINKKEDFEKTMQNIKWEELGGMKNSVRKLFDEGLVTDAQNLANEMSNINRPDSLLLFGIIGIEDDLILNVIIIGSVLIALIVGYIIGSKGDKDDDGDGDYEE